MFRKLLIMTSIILAGCGTSPQNMESVNAQPVKQETLPTIAVINVNGREPLYSVLFKRKSATIASSDSSKLENIVDELKSHNGIIVQGAAGVSTPKGKALATKRQNTVVKELLQLGINKNRILLGEYDPARQGLRTYIYSYDKNN